jgi:hypothetical protein
MTPMHAMAGVLMTAIIIKIFWFGTINKKDDDGRMEVKSEGG